MSNRFTNIAGESQYTGKYYDKSIGNSVGKQGSVTGCLCCLSHLKGLNDSKQLGDRWFLYSKQYGEQFNNMNDTMVEHTEYTN